LIHERGFDRIPDRPEFIERFESAQTRLKAAIAAKKGVDTSVPCSVM
jgi:hypothetical protein